MSKKIKTYEYEFNVELSDILEGIFEKTGFYPIMAEKKEDNVKIVFEEELPPSSLSALKIHIQSKLPSFKLKKQQTKEVEINDR